MRHPEKNKKNAFIIFFFLVAFFAGSLAVTAQSLLASLKNDLIFSAIRGTISKHDTVPVPVNATIKNMQWSGDQAADFKIELLKSFAGQGKTLLITFQPPQDFIGIARAGLQIPNLSGKPGIIIHLTGLSTKGLEGENEPTLSVVADALGYGIDIGWTSLANHSRPELQGDEIPFSLFHKAGKGKVTMQPVARYSPDFELPFGYYTNTNNGPDKKQAGVLAKAGQYPEHQGLFPALASGASSFDPGSENFGFYATGPTHNAYSEDVWNMLLHPENAVRAVRIYPVKDKKGNVIKYTYLVCFEEAKNGDYNDYVFLVQNIVPVTVNLFMTIFNGKDLSGWHTFINGKGSNIDPEKNFRIEDGALHVIGKELGYAITDSAYHNYHLTAQFKWGQKKWTPRENAKRDAGICYNIPINEPDSIWPVSIECQVQEGDVGDFWLLGFSTINADGKINIPSAHTQVVKKKDGEKPTGEWNTVEIISYNGTCMHIVNGIVVNAGKDASVKDGRILLQSEYSEVYYRNVKIRKL